MYRNVKSRRNCAHTIMHNYKCLRNVCKMTRIKKSKNQNDCTSPLKTFGDMNTNIASETEIQQAIPLTEIMSTSTYSETLRLNLDSAPETGEEKNHDFTQFVPKRQENGNGNETSTDLITNNDIGVHNDQKANKSQPTARQEWDRTCQLQAIHTTNSITKEFSQTKQVHEISEV